MLVIRRRPGESLVIGEDVEIEILDSTSSQVKLGIRAPKSVAVLRKEIHVVGQQNRTAAQEISGQAAEKLLTSLKKPGLKPISPLL
jgi:carbon storage regulator